MYEKEVIKSVGLCDRILVNVVLDDGYMHMSVSGGNSEQDVSPGDGNTTVSSGNGEVVHTGNDNMDDSTSVSVDYSSYFQTIQEEVSGIKLLASLIFFFLLLVWTERKISMVVGRFTQWKKGR